MPADRGQHAVGCPRLAARAAAAWLALGALACLDGPDPGEARRATTVVAASNGAPHGEPALPPSTERVLGDVAPRLEPRNVTRTDAHNEANPRFSRDGRLLGFERRDGSAQAIFVADLDDASAPPRRISSVAGRAGAASLEDELLGTGPSDGSFNTELAFLPDASAVVFTGNGGQGDYRLWRKSLAGQNGSAESLTGRQAEAGHPAVSPDGRFLAYVSARQGAGKLVLRDLRSGEERQLGRGPHVDLHPVWSPDSRALAYTSGTNDNHDVFLIRDVSDPEAQPQALTLWNFDDLRPVFSPDGREIAFYSNFSPLGDPDEWSILTVPADGSGPTKGTDLARRVAARNVVKDSAVGPAWLPRGRALVYARNLKEEWNPIYVVDLASGEERRVETDTRMNHDLTCSSRGWIAFRAQVGSWDDIFVAPLVRVP